MPLPHQAWKAIGEGWWASNELDFLTEILKIGQDYIKKKIKYLRPLIHRRFERNKDQRKKC